LDLLCISSLLATAPPAIYTLSLTTLFRSRLRLQARTLPDDLLRRRLRGSEPVRLARDQHLADQLVERRREERLGDRSRDRAVVRSEEHTSELQSRENLVCRLLLEKKNRSN